MAQHGTYDAEQLDRIRRIGDKMRQAAPITSRNLTPPGESKMSKPMKGGTPSSSTKKSKY